MSTQSNSATRTATFFIFAAILLISIVACTSQAAVSTPTAVPTATATETPSPSPTAIPTDTPTPTPAVLGSNEVFDMISPAVGYVDTPTGSGSSLLIDGGYIVTNYHVVWPFDKARIVFPNGEEFLDVPVINWDPLSDMAVLGPIETDVRPLVMSDGEGLPIGSEVYLVGYPGEVDKFPVPSITRGLISRVREWEPGNITYFQTDAKITGGQSGGVLVSKTGDVIGISSYSFSNADFGIVGSATDLEPRILKLIAGEDVSELGNRKLTLAEAKEVQRYVIFDNANDIKVYMMSAPQNTEINIEATGNKADLAFIVNDITGYRVLGVDDSSSGSEKGTFTTEADAPYFLQLFNVGEWSEPVTVKANTALSPVIDLDDYRGILKGHSRTGNIDYPEDYDIYLVSMERGETINVTVDSIMVDTYLAIADKEGVQTFASDTNSGGGIFGSNPEVSFTAPKKDTYWLVVGPETPGYIGGYSISVRDMYENAPTPVVPTPTATAMKTDNGYFTTYEANSAPISIQIPAGWSNDPAATKSFAQLCQIATDCFVGDSLLAIAEETIPSMMGIKGLDDYVDLSLEVATSQQGATIVANEAFVTDSGLNAKVIEVSFNDTFSVRKLIFVYNNVAFNASYFIFDPETEIDMRAIIDDSFRSLSLTK